MRRFLARLADEADATRPSGLRELLEREAALARCEVCDGEGQLEERAEAAGERALRASARHAGHVVTWCRFCPQDVRLGRLRGVSAHDIAACTFPGFDTDTAARRQALSATMRWVGREDARPFLVLSGPAGVGKSHLATAAAVQLALKGYGVVFVEVSELLDALKASYDGDQRAEGRVNAVYLAHVLVLDDLGAERATDWTQTELRKLLTQRYARHQLTAITTNFGLADIAKRQSDDPNGRLVSRLADVARSALVELTGSDYRQRRRAG